MLNLLGFPMKNKFSFFLSLYICFLHGYIGQGIKIGEEAPKSPNKPNKPKYVNDDGNLRSNKFSNKPQQTQQTGRNKRKYL